MFQKNEGNLPINPALASLVKAPIEQDYCPGIARAFSDGLIFASSL